jgi:hypothetical protein
MLNVFVGGARYDEIKSIFAEDSGQVMGVRDNIDIQALFEIGSDVFASMGDPVSTQRAPVSGSAARAHLEDTWAGFPGSPLAELFERRQVRR